VSDPRVTGAVRYAQDVELEGMLHARIVRSPYPHARITRVDASAVPGTAVVLLPDDVRALGDYGPQLQDTTVLALDVARYAGDPVAAVAAATPAEAAAVAALVEVDYEELPAVFDAVEAAGDDAPRIHEIVGASENEAAYFDMRPQPGTNVCHRFRLRHGDPAAAFDDCDVVVEETYRTAGAQHAHMEPHASAARWHGDRLEVWTGTQTPYNLRSDLARIFRMHPDRIRVVSPPMGGAFGAKTFVRLEGIVAALARKAERPVKCVLDRAEEWQTLNRHPAVVRVRLAAKADGALVGAQFHCWADTGAYADCGPGVTQKMGFAAAGPYRIPHVWVDADCVYTNLPPNGAFRGYGQMQATWAREAALDRLAARLGIDPVELRLKNVLRDGDRYCTGEEMRDCHYDECLRAAAGAIGWNRGRRGKGVALLLKGMQTPSRAEIAVEADADGTYTIRCATTEMGQGAWRAISLLAAEELGVDISQVRYAVPDTDLTPYDTRTTSSRSTYVMAEALKAAVRDLRANGRKGHGTMEISGGLDPDTGQGVASHHWHQGAAAAEVRVDEETGKIEVLRLHAAIYAGRVVNRPAAELQNEGSMIMGLGTALFEAIDFVEGQVTNANLSDYVIPAFADMPERLSHDLIERPGGDIHGLGETALPPVPAAIGNALASLDLRLSELPLSPEAVLEALDIREGAKV
jgi:CO/xanthine dehydrogenase Mo-binding subunit